MTANRSGRLRAGATVVGLLALCVVASPARAARPAPGGRYVAAHFVPGKLDVALQLTPDARALTSDGGSYGGSRFAVYADCLKPDGTVAFPDDQEGASLGAPSGAPARVSRGGRISLSIGFHESWGLHGGLHITVRFVTHNRATIRVAGGWREPTSDNGRCRAHVNRVEALRLHRPPPFAGCARQSGTLLRGPQGQVYRQHDVTDFGTRTSFDFGCLNAERRPVRLDIDGFDDDDYKMSLDDFQLAGPYVAYVVWYCTLDCVVYVAVVDLRNGSTRLHSAGSTYLSTMGNSNLAIDAILLDQQGSIAWLTQWCDLHSPGACPAAELTSEVWKMGHAGASLLDSGHGIDTQSLQLAGPNVTWRHDGVVRSAPLD